MCVQQVERKGVLLTNYVMKKVRLARIEDR